MQTTQNHIEATAVTLDDVLPLEKFQELHADRFTRSQLTWIVRNRDRNGLAKTGAVILLSRKFYINTPIFARWVADQKA